MPANRDNWETPAAFVARVAVRLGISAFTLDVCATAKNSKAINHLGPSGLYHDGLAYPWTGTYLWMNPPYSEMAKWLKKANEERRHYAKLVALLDCRPWDTLYWHEEVLAHGEAYGASWIIPIKGRIKFERDGKVGPNPASGNLLVGWDRVPPYSPVILEPIDAH